MKAFKFLFLAVVLSMSSATVYAKTFEQIMARIQQLNQLTENEKDVKKVIRYTDEVLALSKELAAMLPQRTYDPNEGITVLNVTADKIWTSSERHDVSGYFSKVRITAIDAEVVFKDGFTVLGSSRGPRLHFNIYSLRANETQEFDLGHDYYSKSSHRWESSDSLLTDSIEFHIESANYNGTRGKLKIEFLP